MDYIQNPDKTEDGALVVTSGCTPENADLAFAFEHDQYEKSTGRKREKSSVIAYHMCQSFRPGEITPELAIALGTALEERFTKGNHSCTVSVHTDKAHIHLRIIF